MRRFILLTIALFWTKIFCNDYRSRDVDKRCWEDTSVTDPVLVGGTLKMFCDPCETQTVGVKWMKEHGTWDDSNLQPVVFKTRNNEYTVGRHILNWDMSFSIYDVEPGDAGRYRCSRGREVYSWHEVIIRNASKLHVVDTRKNQRPYGMRLGVHTRWSDWGPCSQCDEPGTRERVGYCYPSVSESLENPLKQYHNGIPCNFPHPQLLIWQMLALRRIALQDEKIIEGCSVTCREADKEARHRKVRPYFYPFHCMLEIAKHFRKFMVVYGGDTLRMKCHHCAELYGGVVWYRSGGGVSDRPVTFDWHDNDDENKFALNYDMSMEIRKADPQDEGRYVCIRKEEVYSIYEVVVKERPTELHVVDKRKNQKSYGKRHMVYTVWMDWGPCSTCDKPGTRIRMGYCFSNTRLVVGNLAKKYPTGVPCNFKTANRFDWNIIRSEMLDEKMIDTCDEPCLKCTWWLLLCTHFVNTYDKGQKMWKCCRKCCVFFSCLDEISRSNGSG